MTQGNNPLPEIRRKMLDTGDDIFAPGVYTTLDPYRYVLHRDSGEDLIRQVDHIFAAGALFVLAMRLSGIATVKRSSFDMTSLAPLVFQDAVDNAKSVYLIGSKPAEVRAAVQGICTRFTGLSVIGFRHGYFADQQERRAELKNIADLRPDVVVCGMGVLTQERFLLDLWQHGWRGAAYTCGGFLHQAARRLEYFPPALDKLHLRWLYRMLDEPRIVVRVVQHYTRFLYRFARDLAEYRQADGTTG